MKKSKIEKIKLGARTAWDSLFHGMAGADAVMNGSSTSTDGIEVSQHIKGSGFFNDMLDQKLTQEVVEMRDKYYRILRESDKYKVTLSGSISEDEMDDENAMMFAAAKKKDASDFMKHPPVYEEKGYKLRTIQDNKHIVNKIAIVGINEGIDGNYFGKGLYDYQTTITVERDNFIPRFELDKFVTRMVVKNKDDNSNRAHVDLYLPTIASQFGKIDAILISNLNQIYTSKNFRSDILDFKTIEWYSDKAWNSDDVCLFKYDDCRPIDMCIFDGSFVITYDCNIISNGEYLAKKFETDELTKKYEENAPKKDATDISAILRKIEKENKEEIIDTNNIKNTTFKLS